MGKKTRRIDARCSFFFACTLITVLFISGCSHLYEGSQVRLAFKEANVFFNQGNYKASLRTYEQIIAKHPTMGDRALFEMGMIYAYPVNKQKDYHKSLECFQKLIRMFPESEYKQGSEMMIFHINNVIANDKRSTTQQTQIESLQQEIKSKGSEITTLQKMIEALEQKVFEILNVP